jgi:guanylate kinase
MEEDPSGSYVEYDDYVKDAGKSPIQTARIAVQKEGASHVFEISIRDLNKIRKLMSTPIAVIVFPEEVNNILNKYEPVKTVATLYTLGDDWGWIEEAEECT